MRKCRSLLDQVIGNQVEVLTLGEDGGFILQGSIGEMEYKTSRYLVAARDLGEIADCDLLPVKGAEHEKTVGQAFLVADRSIGGAGQHAGENRNYCNQAREKSESHRDVRLPWTRLRCSRCREGIPGAVLFAID